jgi:hypothetical protein
MADPSAIWQEYGYLALVPMLVTLVLLILSKLIRVAVGRWFYGR